jgi:hypothetical protein
MNSFTKNLIGTLIAAAIVANASLLWSISDRLARLETKMEALVNHNARQDTAANN